MAHKKFCSVHHYYYEGTECPFCADDRIKQLSKRFCTEGDEDGKEKDREISEDDISRLMDKFNVKKQ